MILRQIGEKQFEWFHHFLLEGARADPMNAIYTVNLKINDVEYDVKLLLEEENQIAILQATRIDRGKYGSDFELITDDKLLSSFLEILLYQGPC